MFWREIRLTDWIVPQGQQHVLLGELRYRMQAGPILLGRQVPRERLGSLVYCCGVLHRDGLHETVRVRNRGCDVSATAIDRVHARLGDGWQRLLRSLVQLRLLSRATVNLRLQVIFDELP